MSMQFTPGCQDSSALVTVEIYVQLLRRSNSALVLMDMSAELPDLKRTKGLTNWLVKGQNKFYSDWEEAQEEAVGSLITCTCVAMPGLRHGHQVQCPALKSTQFVSQVFCIAAPAHAKERGL